jgi:hypothetical protein
VNKGPQWLITLRPDGTSSRGWAPEHGAASLKALQKAVDGEVECINVEYPGIAGMAYVNKDRRNLKLPYNTQASLIAMQAVLGNMVTVEDFAEGTE